VDKKEKKKKRKGFSGHGEQGTVWPKKHIQSGNRVGDGDKKSGKISQVFPGRRGKTKISGKGGDKRALRCLS